MIMNFQIVEVHKPLLAVSRLVKDELHILLLTGVKVPMKCNMGAYEVEVYILNRGFTRPG